MPSNLQVSLSRVREGSITFEEFVASTKTEFRRMAQYLLRRWVSPLWYAVEDVEQELYLGAWNHIWRYEQCLSNGVSLARYIVYNAMAAAKTQLHKARGVTISGSPDRKPSNVETPLSFIGEDDGDGEALMESLLAEAPVAETSLVTREEWKEAVAKLLEVCQTPKERFAILALREARTVDNAGLVLYDDFDHRIELRLGSEEVANRFVIRHASAVAERVLQMTG